MIKEFAQFLFKNPVIEKILTKAYPIKHHARRYYQKAGFLVQGEINTPDGKSMLLILEKIVIQAMAILIHFPNLNQYVNILLLQKMFQSLEYKNKQSQGKGDNHNMNH